MTSSIRKAVRGKSETKHVVVHGAYRPEKFGAIHAHTLCGVPVDKRVCMDRTAARHIIRRGEAMDLCPDCERLL